MKPLFLGICIILFIASTFAQKYVLVWNDEFNTPGLPDSTKWNYETGKIRNNELQYYTAGRLKNARIEDSVLVIEAHKEKFDGADYTSASIISKGAGDWKYGKFEIRAKVPTGKGTWPAIWMMPTYSEYGGWPKSGEIDIMEYIGVEPQNLWYNAHFEGKSGDGHDSNGSGRINTISNPWEKFITFTLLWTPIKMEWYADGVKYHEYIKPADDYQVWPFNKEFYLILNLAYGGSWGGYNGVDDSKLPHRFLIDYVRVYQLQETEGPFSLNIEPATGGNIIVSPEMEKYPENTEVTLTAIPQEKYAFRAWRNQSRANPFTFYIRKNTLIKPAFSLEGELLSNGNFDYNLQNWNFYVFNQQQISFTKTLENGVFIMDILKTTGIDWHLGFQENGLSMHEGKYRLSFEAYATQARQLLITVSKNYPDWGSFVSKNVNITTSKKKFELTINMPVNDDNVRLYFGVGKFSGKFYIDNISLTRQEETTSLPTASKPGKNTFTIFPNPGTGLFNVTFNVDELMSPKFEVINLSGKIVWSGKIEKTMFQINLQHLQPGFYFIRAFNPVYSEIQKISIVQ